MSDSEQDRTGPSPETKPSKEIARGAFKMVDNSTRPPRGGNLGFAAICLVAATAAGAFLAWETGGGPAGPRTVSAPAPPAEPAFHSRVADVCDVGWKNDRLNRDQIHCWLTRDVLRLCDPRERAALVGRLVDYEAAKERKEVRLQAAVLLLRGNPDVATELMAFERSRDMSLSEGQRQAEAEKAMSLSRKNNAAINKVQEESQNEVAPGVNIRDLADLVEAGYLIAEDFPDPMPGLAAKGFAAAGHDRAKPCLR